MSEGPRPPTRAFGSSQQIWRRPGIRLAVLQVVVILAAFVVAGQVARSEIQALSERTFRREILGEMSSLQDEILRQGESRLPKTIERRTRLWRGFEYDLVSSRGEVLGGRLGTPVGQLGWQIVTGRGAWGQGKTFLAYAQTTPSGAWLSVGKNLEDVQREMRLVTWRLIGAGLIGALASLAAWMIFAQETWRRLARISDTAHQVRAGSLALRVPHLEAHLADDIDDVGLAMNQMLDRIGGLIAQLRQVTTDVAHDLRTPLSRMRQKLERLERSARLATEDRDSVSAIHGDLLELLRTFDALLQLSEIEGRNLSEDGVVLDLEEVARRVADAFRPDVEDSGRRLQIETSAAWVQGDPDLLAQLVANLIENALRHTPTGAIITVGTGLFEDHARVWVADNGPGIAADQRKAVLAPYFRLDQSRGSAGSGLGLSIVAAIATRHNAELVLSDNGPGLRVTVGFDRRSEPADRQTG